MAQLIPALVVGGAKAYQGYQAQKMKRQEAQAYREAKNRRMGAATREMAEEERNKERMHSRAIALAASSGAGVDDPGMVKLLSDLNAEGTYRIMSRLWQGINDAQGLIYRSEAALREGQAALEAGIISGVSTVFSAYAGGGGFGGAGATSFGGSGGTVTGTTVARGNPI